MISEKLLKYFNGDYLAANVWYNKYRAFDEETPKDSELRYAKEFAEVEYGRIQEHVTEPKISQLSIYGQTRYRELLNKDFPGMVDYVRSYINIQTLILGGSLLQGIGQKHLYSSLSNCLVLGHVPDSYSGISQKSEELVQTCKRRMGNGMNLSHLRPKGAKIHNQANTSVGIVPYAERFSELTKEVAQFGRRGACMLNVDINHPDSIDFAESKQDLTKLTGVNISIIFDTEFLEAVFVDKSSSYLQRYPVDLDVSELNHEDFEYDKLTYIKNVNHKEAYVKRINPVEAWNKLIHFAWNTGEPGLLFKCNWRDWGTDYCYIPYRPVSTNPCVPGQTKIRTSTGHEPIEDYVGKTVKIWNGYEWSNVVPELTGQNQQLYIVHVKDPVSQKVTTIPCTSYHKWHLNRGIVEANSLVVGDKLVEFYSADKQRIMQNFEIVEITKSKYLEKNVYCFNEPKNHTGVFNGILTGNCSEIPMQPYDSCRLMAINLLTILYQNTRGEYKVDWEKLYRVAYEQQTFMDAVVDMDSKYIAAIIHKIKNDPNEDEELKRRELMIWEKIQAQGLKGRRTGSGFTGLGDLLMYLGYGYNNNPDTLQFLDRLFNAKMRAELDATIDMSILYGSFEGFDYELEASTNNNLFQLMSERFPGQMKRMEKYGRRNVSWSTAAPTGSLSILTQTTSGIEPMFKPYVFRRVKCTKETDRKDFQDPADGQWFTVYKTIHPQFAFWIMQRENLTMEQVYNLSEEELQKLCKISRYNGNSADDIHWEARIQIQSIVQQYTTHAISSTINLPNDCSEETVSNIYNAAWKAGLKGITVFRDGSRAGIFDTGLNKSTKKKEVLEYQKRPKSLDAKVFEFTSQKKKYTVFVGVLDGKPYEIFCCEGWFDIPDNSSGQIIKKKKGHYVFKPDNQEGEIIVHDEADELKDLSLFISMLLRHKTPLKYVIKTINKTKPIAGGFAHRLMKILSSFVPNNETTGEKCPECSGILIFENGCHICKNCGHTKC